MSDSMRWYVVHTYSGYENKLERNGGRRKAAADELNISQRTLYRKIKEYGLE